MPLQYTILDVFTDVPFKGNPLAVVTIPQGTQLSYSQKLAIAKEFNLSETTFVHDVGDSRTTERTFDIFTREDEIPFAGHPTIGTAAFLQSLGVTTLHAKAGAIKIEVVAGGGLRAKVPHHTRLHQSPIPRLDTHLVGDLPTQVAEAEAGAPLFSIVNGMAFALIELPSIEVLAGVKIGMPELRADLLDNGWRKGWITRRYYYVNLGQQQKNGRTVHSIRARMVKLGTEDAATGSAACALAGYLSLHRHQDEALTYDITQGVEMGRESLIQVDVDIHVNEKGGRELSELHLGGRAVPAMSGTILNYP